MVSLTGALAEELGDAVVQTAGASAPDDQPVVRKSPPPGSMEGRDRARLTILASGRPRRQRRRRNHPVSPVVIRPARFRFSLPPVWS